MRGDLGAVVRAILTDYEARSPAFLNSVGFGKSKEPLLRATAVSWTLPPLAKVVAGAVTSNDATGVGSVGPSQLVTRTPTAVSSPNERMDIICSRQ